MLDGGEGNNFWFDLSFGRLEKMRVTEIGIPLYFQLYIPLEFVKCLKISPAWRMQKKEENGLKLFVSGEQKE